jgi:Zn-dependent peptidase ImmA (M78 family)
MNQEELAEIFELSAAMVSAIESGSRTFTGSLEKIGYSDDRFELPEMSEPLHRHRASTAVAAKKRAKELIRLAGELFAELRQRTPLTPMLALERNTTPVASFNELEEFALEVRCALGHEETGPVKNLTAAVERAGVCLVPIVGLKGIDGLSAWVEDIPVIGIDPSVPGDRFRFGIGHELLHLMRHTKKSDVSESEANRFAGALLFPLAEFEEAMQSRAQLQNFVTLKSTWGVSVAALVYRAHELGFIDDTRYRQLQIQMSKWHRSEPADFAPVPGALFPRLIEVNGGVPEVATALGVNKKHLAELCNWSHLRLA